eukprot:TRINITY_DN13121_c0_g1_i1.p2 TRINITY_DN13121_c0_g1~~TRINITY_DN13121_c0_g1_i1.p2  ORF type:complete len:137 (-),score=15.81 TRINITY_DN13121_c0_g1_i1:186-596(-)
MTTLACGDVQYNLVTQFLGCPLDRLLGIKQSLAADTLQMSASRDNQKLLFYPHRGSEAMSTPPAVSAPAAPSANDADDIVRNIWLAIERGDTTLSVVGEILESVLVIKQRGQSPHSHLSPFVDSAVPRLVCLACSC